MEHMFSPELAATQEHGWERAVPMWVLGTQTLGLSETLVSSSLLVWFYSDFKLLAEKRGRGVSPCRLAASPAAAARESCELYLCLAAVVKPYKLRQLSLQPSHHLPPP